MQSDGRRAPAGAREIDSNAVEGPLIDRPVELAHAPSLDALLAHEIDLGVPRGRVAARRVRHAPKLKAEPREDFFESKVEIPHVYLAEVGAAGVGELDGAETQWTGPGRGRRQPGEPHVLCSRRRSVAPRGRLTESCSRLAPNP